MFARRIVGWRASRTAHATFVLDALDQALHARRPAPGDGLVHHSDRGGQYLPIRYTERLADAGVVPSVGSVGDSYDNAHAETINGLYKAEVIHRRGPWRSLEAVEYATLERVDWFNNRRLLEPIGNIPPAEAEQRWWDENEQAAIAARLKAPSLRRTRRGSMVIGGGGVLLGLFLLFGRLWGGAVPDHALAALTNMWVGVTKAGYSVHDELPILLIVFGVPAALAAVVVWRLASGVWRNENATAARRHVDRAASGAEAPLGSTSVSLTRRGCRSARSSRVQPGRW